MRCFEIAASASLSRSPHQPRSRWLSRHSEDEASKPGRAVRAARRASRHFIDIRWQRRNTPDFSRDWLPVIFRGLMMMALYERGMLFSCSIGRLLQCPFAPRRFDALREGCRSRHTFGHAKNGHEGRIIYMLAKSCQDCRISLSFSL